VLQEANASASATVTISFFITLKATFFWFV
jgi:hypothetical protein